MKVVIKIMIKSFSSVHPFVKWAGGKSQILHKIRERYPTGLGSDITKYAEPFVGGGAVLFDILENYAMSEVYISDVNRELIHTYTVIRDDLDGLFFHLRQFGDEYLNSSENTRKDIYYRNRERYNMLKLNKYLDAELAAMFIFLNRTCFNGLYRVNSHGEFNVPQGSYKNPKICDEENLSNVSAKLKNVNIVYGDYKESQWFIDPKTFVYFDPPYRPLTATANFTSYSSECFDDKQQIELAQFIMSMSDRGAYIAASNSDPKNTDENDDFLEKLYDRFKINKVTAIRAINSNCSKRGQIWELLISNS
jgi:DNA adenine methylase